MAVEATLRRGAGRARRGRCLRSCGGDETGGGDADLDEDQGVDGAVDVRGRHGGVVVAVVACLVLDAVLTRAGDVHGVRLAVLGNGAEGRELCLGESLCVHLEVARGLLTAPGIGDGTVHHLGRDGARGLRTLGDEIFEFGRARLHPLPTGRANAVLGLRAGRTERAGRAGGDLVQLPVQLVVKVRPQRKCRHRADHRADHGDQHHGRDDEPRPQRARLSSSPLLTRPSSPAHDAAGLIR